MGFFPLDFGPQIFFFFRTRTLRLVGACDYRVLPMPDEPHELTLTKENLVS